MTPAFQPARPQRHARLAQGVIVAILSTVVSPTEADTPIPPDRHAEQHAFDPERGTWVRTPDPVPGTEDGDLDIARQWMAREKYKTALEIIEEWIETYGPQSDRYPEALYLKGTALLQRGRYRAAHDTYQSLLNDFPGSEFAEPTLWGEYRIAEQYLAGKRKRVWGGLFRFKNYEGGLEIMDDLVVNYADTELAERAQMAKADHHFSRGEFELAEEEYAVYARNYPRSRQHQRALLRSAEAALASFPGIHFDDAGLVEARERYLQYRRTYPAAAEDAGVDVIVQQIDATRADKTFEIAEFYRRTDQPRAANFYYRAIVRNWPDTPAAARANGRLEIQAEQEITPEITEGEITPAETGEEGDR